MRMSLLLFTLVLSICSFSQGIWKQKTDFPGTGRSGAAGFAIGTKGYIIGGIVYETTAWSNEFWE
jgi:hypothetical protein